MKKLLIILLFIPFLSLSQDGSTFLKELVEKINSESPQTHPITGIIMKGAMSYGNTLVYMYDVPKDWYPTNNMKEQLIENFKAAEIADVYFQFKINVDFQYFKEYKLIKTLKIKYNDFSDKNNFNFSLGEYHSLYSHPKAKGVNIKIKKPKGFEIMEGNRPNIVTKYNNKENNLVYTVLIKNLPFFVSRNETKDLIFESDPSIYAKEIISEINGNYISSRYLQIDRYPALEYIMEVEKEIITDQKINMKLISWMIYYEDKIITLSGTTLKENFEKFKNLFLSITNSIVFEDQYNSIYNTLKENEENFETYVDKFYRELEIIGINKTRPQKINIKLEPLDSFKETSHLHGFSLGYKNDNVIDIYINKRSWNTFSKAEKYYLIFHELCHDVLNLDDINYKNSNEKNIMYPMMNNYSNLSMDDFIENFHRLLEEYLD